MKRQTILIAACGLAAVSLGGNIWLLMHRKDKTAAPGPAAQTTPHDATVGPVLQPVAMDFSDTAFADGSWKLTDETDPSVSLDKPFKWDDVEPAGPEDNRELNVSGPLNYAKRYDPLEPVEGATFDPRESTSPRIMAPSVENRSPTVQRPANPE